jgi:hypothetical protein
LIERDSRTRRRSLQPALLGEEIADQIDERGRVIWCDHQRK